MARQLFRSSLQRSHNTEHLLMFITLSLSFKNGQLIVTVEPKRVEESGRILIHGEVLSVEWQDFVMVD